MSLTLPIDMEDRRFHVGEITDGDGYGYDGLAVAIELRNRKEVREILDALRHQDDAQEWAGQIWHDCTDKQRAALLLSIEHTLTASDDLMIHVSNATSNCPEDEIEAVRRVFQRAIAVLRGAPLDLIEKVGGSGDED